MQNLSNHAAPNCNTQKCQGLSNLHTKTWKTTLVFYSQIQHFVQVCPISEGPNLPGPNLPGPNLPGPNLSGPNLPHQGPNLPQHQKVRGPICRKIGEVPNLSRTQTTLGFTIVLMCICISICICLAFVAPPKRMNFRKSSKGAGTEAGHFQSKNLYFIQRGFWSMKSRKNFNMIFQKWGRGVKGRLEFFPKNSAVLEAPPVPKGQWGVIYTLSVKSTRRYVRQKVTTYLPSPWTNSDCKLNGNLHHWYYNLNIDIYPRSHWNLWPFSPFQA